MLVTKGVGEAAVAGRLEMAGGLRAVELVGDLEPKLELLAGVFARRGERDSFPADHPLNMLWDAMETLSRRYRQRDTGPSGDPFGDTPSPRGNGVRAQD